MTDPLSGLAPEARVRDDFGIVSRRAEDRARYGNRRSHGKVAEAPPVPAVKAAVSRAPNPPQAIAAEQLDAESAAVAVERVTAAVAGVMGLNPTLIFFAAPIGPAIHARLIVIELIVETRRHLPLAAIAEAAGYTGEGAIMRVLDRCSDLLRSDPSFAGWYGRARERLRQP